MYNSEEVYTFEENRQTQSQHPSADEQKNGRLHNSRPKNGLFSGQKQNGISGTYARIVPKRPLHDMERLYAENMQLRERIKILEEDCTKIKTRVSMAERQKQQLITQLCNAEFGSNVLRDRRPSQKGLNKTQQKPMKSAAFDENRKILHSYKDEISKLKIENGRLKKTVKYTQIQQLQTQNQLLHQEMARMKRYTQDVIENTQYDEYEKQIEVLNKQLMAEKDSKKNMQMQMKKKDEEMEDLKNKMKIIANRKSELEKKYNREITSIKSELHRAKEKQKQYFVSNQEKKQASKSKVIEKIGECKKCSSFKDNLDSQKQKNKELTSKLSEKQKSITQLNKKIQDLEIKKSKASEPSSPYNDVKNQKSSENNLKKVEHKEKRKQTEGKQKQKVQRRQHSHPQKKDESQKIDEKKHEIIENKKEQKESYEDENDDDYNEDSEEMGNTKNFNGELSVDKVDVFHVNMSNQKQQKEPSKNNKNDEDRYEEQFDQSENKKQGNDDSEEQVLFQKQDKAKPKKKKTDQAVKQKRKEKSKEKQVDKQKGGSSKAQKILKETIKYRLMAQRYCYSDFHRDIKESGATQFNIEELIQMLTNEPFFLSEQHLQLVLYSLFQKEELDETDTTTTNSFLKKMKIFIGDFEIKEESEEQVLLKSIQSKLVKKKILAKMKQESINDAQISKKGFVKVLKQFVGLNEAQIEQCLAEASVLSVDIAHINYPEFLQKLGYS